MIEGVRHGPTGTIFRIARYAIHDGPGIRTTVFFKGCPLRCWWCHSPESQESGPELAIKQDRCAGCEACVQVCPEKAVHREESGVVTDRQVCRRCGRCAEGCPTGAREISGTTMTVDALMAEIEKDVLFFDQSGGGVTFSGGEPLMQIDFLEAVLRRSKASRIHTAVDTCGYAPRTSLLRVVDCTDLFLFDIKAIDEDVHELVTGRSNSQILANLRLLAGLGAAVRVRFPLVPGVNDADGSVEALARTVLDTGLGRVDVLPYHRAGLAKYDRFGHDCRGRDLRPPSDADIERVTSILVRAGLEVRVGG
ncbi:MAG: glycyl-radical enzyme activating protein [Vicinamibacterales bacterium]